MNSSTSYDLTQPGTIVFTLGDNQGTIRDLATYDSTTGTTSIVTHRIYDSYGNLVSSTGTVDCLFGYTGRAFDTYSSLQNNWHRWYDAKVGRWVSEDWIGYTAGQTNIDVYCGNSPANAVDPRGLEPKPSPKFQPPTNPPQPPLSPEQVPPGWRLRIMPPTAQYPNGYWRLEKPMPNGGWQGIDPSTMKPGPQPNTHVPLPPSPSTPWWQKAIPRLSLPIMFWPYETTPDGRHIG